VFLIAAFVNRKYYGEKKTVPPTPTTTEEPQRHAGPPPTAAEQYANLIKQREMEAKDAMFVVKAQTFIVAVSPLPVWSKDDPKRVEGFNAGKLFDVTKKTEGLRPEMLFRRGMFRHEHHRVYGRVSAAGRKR